MTKRVLIVAAHPDDQVIGCGGTVARLVKEGWEATCLILGEGATSRDARRDRSKRSRELSDLRKQTLKADRVLGIKESVVLDFPDNRFDTVPLLELVKAVEAVKDRVRPHLVFTHDAGDLNVDHRAAHAAVLTATRPMQGEPVRELYAFEVASSSEWAYPTTFSPDVFFDVSATLETKLKSMAEYTGELRPPPHPRSLEGLRASASAWGFKTGTRYAEAFRTVRVLR